MNKSITEGMKKRKQIIEYAIKKNNAKAARKYNVTRQYVNYWKKRQNIAIYIIDMKGQHKYKESYKKKDIQDATIQ